MRGKTLLLSFGRPSLLCKSLSISIFIPSLLLKVSSLLFYSGNKSLVDGLVKSLKRRFSVIPVQTGIQYFRVVRILWIPVFTGMTTFYEFILVISFEKGVLDGCYQ